MTTPSDVSWKSMFGEVECLNEVTPHTKMKILDGWMVLADLLGSDWPEYAQEQNHPWIGEWYNKAPWVKVYYGHIGHQLHMLTTKNHFSAILNRLKASSSSFSAEAEINAAWKLEKASIAFEFVKPSLKKKSYDIQAILDQKEVGIEVSTLEQSQKAKKQWDIFERIATGLMTASFSKLEAAGQIHRMLSQPHAEHILRLIEEGKKEALREDKIVLIKESAFDGCIAPKGKKHQLQEWKQDRGMKEDNNLNAPDFDTSTGRRLHAKILTKSKQIPSETAGVIYIEGIPMYISDKGLMMHKFSMEDIEEAVYENTNNLFVLLNNRSIGWGHTRRFVGDNVYVSKIIRYQLLSELAMLVCNRFPKFPKLRHKKLINAFLG